MIYIRIFPRFRAIFAYLPSATTRYDSSSLLALHDCFLQRTRWVKGHRNHRCHGINY